MKKIRTLLLAAVLLLLLCAMGDTSYAATVRTGQVDANDIVEGDILKAGCEVINVDAVEINGNRKSMGAGLVYTASEAVRVTGKDVLPAPTPAEGEPWKPDTYVLYLETVDVPNTVGATQVTLSPEEAWKRSPQNPKNYLPELTLSDGSVLRSTVPAHFVDSGKNGGISAVFSTTALSDFYRAIGVTGGNGVHMYSYRSLCGPLMKQLFAEHAAALGEQFGAEVTLADIFELQTEIRDKDYKLVDVAAESSETVDIVIGLKNDLLKAAEAGADFAVLAYADGKMTVCMDTDEEVSTVTINTTVTSCIYAIVYAPAGTFAE